MSTGACHSAHLFVGYDNAHLFGRFFEAARIFNAYIGLEIQPVMLTQVASSPDDKALWLWVKAHRPEVASFAEAQQCGNSTGSTLSLQSQPIQVHDASTLDHLPPSPHQSNGLSQNTQASLSEKLMHSQPTQIRAPLGLKRSMQDELTQDTTSQSSFLPRPQHSPAIVACSQVLSQSQTSVSSCELQ